MQATTQEKLKRLDARLQELGSALVAFSGGVDSAFLAVAAARALGERALAVTACSETFPEWEREDAVKLARAFGLRHRLLETSELTLPEFCENSPRRCYFCKAALCRNFRKIATEEGLNAVLDGTNADDLGDYRPGREAAQEEGILSPLLEVGLTKAEIREVSREWGLPTADKPSYACLASRIPFGEPITREKLRQVGEAEEMLRRLGLRQCRVRHHGEIARLETSAGEEEIVLKHRQAIISALHDLGFRYVTLDLEGYRTGSLNPRS